MATTIDFAAHEFEPYSDELSDREEVDEIYDALSADEEYSREWSYRYNDYLRAQQERILKTRGKRVILSLDGGGIRGLSTLLILRRLMEKIARLESERSPMAISSADSPLIPRSVIEREFGNLTAKLDKSRASPFQDKSNTAEFLPCHYFDYIAGTSTGGLIATMLGRLWMSVERTIEEFTNLTEEVYRLRYRSKPRRARRLLSAFGRSPDEKVKDSLLTQFSQFKKEPLHFDDDRCKTIICSFEQVSGKKSLAPLYFRSYSPPGQSLVPKHGDKRDSLHYVSVTDVLLATGCNPYRSSPVPLYGHAVIDAGFRWPNPAGGVFEEFQRHHKKSDTLMISLGCGYIEADSSQPVRKGWSRSGIGKTTMSINQALYTLCEEVHESMLQKVRKAEVTYFRLNTPLDLGKIENTPGECWKTELQTLRAEIQRSTDEYLNKDKGADATLEECATALVDLRRRRCVMPDWESFVFGNKQYKCEANGSCDGKKVTYNRENLVDHIRIHHEMGASSPEVEQRIHMLVDKGRVKTDASLESNMR